MPALIGRRLCADPIVLIPNEGSGEWTVDCDGCFDEATLTIDPAIAGSGWLAITHVLAGTCIDDYEETEMFIAGTPSPQLTASTEALCDDDFFDFNATPPFGTWSASCGGCIIPNTGVFFADQADAGLNTVTFTTLGVCDTSVEVGVSEEQAGVIRGPSCCARMTPWFSRPTSQGFGRRIASAASTH